jgi:hypothetical protein
LAPSLYKLARHRFRNVQTELYNLNWVTDLDGINSAPLLEEFVLLFMTLPGITLTQDKDEIKWNWTSNHYVKNSNRRRRSEMSL